MCVSRDYINFIVSRLIGVGVTVDVTNFVGIIPTFSAQRDTRAEMEAKGRHGVFVSLRNTLIITHNAKCTSTCVLGVYITVTSKTRASFFDNKSLFAY